MTRRRRWLLGSALLACVVVVCFLLLNRSPINQSNYERIREGMTHTEVEEILGRFPRDESSGELVPEPPEGQDFDETEALQTGWVRVILFESSVAEPALELKFGEPPPPFRMPVVWKSNDIIIRVEFDADGRVASKDALAVRRVRERPLKMLRRWLRL